MKSPILLFFMFGISVFISAYEVPTEKQNKKILLEEYTGVNCGFCSQGHVIANNILVTHPESTYIIAIHAGNYSVPGEGMPDFRTPEGTTINDNIGAGFYNTGYPSGSVNRHVFKDNSPITGRGEWIKNAKSVVSETAPVNLWMKADFDGSSRKLTVKVEGYYTENVKNGFNLLNVAMVQGNIKAYQNGSTLGVNYIHHHVLRDFITPLWGDTINSPKQGDYFTREYVYTLPADINNVELKAEDIELVAFVSEDKTEVLNVTGGKPSYFNYDKPLVGKLSSPDKAIVINYGYNFFEARLENKSSQTVTTAEFEFKLNGTVQTVTWTGTIYPFEERPIQINVQPYEFMPQNDFEITLLKMNGQSVDRSSIKGGFGSPAECTPDLLLELQTDLYADENIFAIKDRDGNMLKEFGPYEVNKKAVYKEEFTLDTDKIYCLEITDLCGDGIQSPRGYYKLYNKEGKTLIAQQYDLNLYGNRFFFKTSITSGIDEVESSRTVSFVQNGKIKVYFTALQSGDVDIALYSISGELISHRNILVSANEACFEELTMNALPNGLYLIKVSRDGKSETLKVSVL